MSTDLYLVPEQAQDITGYLACWSSEREYASEKLDSLRAGPRDYAKREAAAMLRDLSKLEEEVAYVARFYQHEDRVWSERMAQWGQQPWTERLFAWRTGRELKRSADRNAAIYLCVGNECVKVKALVDEIGAVSRGVTSRGPSSQFS